MLTKYGDWPKWQWERTGAFQRGEGWELSYARSELFLLGPPSAPCPKIHFSSDVGQTLLGGQLIASPAASVSCARRVCTHMGSVAMNYSKSSSLRAGRRVPFSGRPSALSPRRRVSSRSRQCSPASAFRLPPCHPPITARSSGFASIRVYSRLKISAFSPTERSLS